MKPVLRPPLRPPFWGRFFPPALVLSLLTLLAWGTEPLLTASVRGTEPRLGGCPDAGQLFSPESPALPAGKLEKLLSELIRENFPELQAPYDQGRIQFRTIESDEYFLQTGFGGFRSTGLIYTIEFNPRLFVQSREQPQKPQRLVRSCRPSQEAIRGILAHELVHLVDYETQLARVTFRLLTDINGYERDTDLQAFERNPRYARGIHDYRLWVYSQLTPTQIKTKRERYLTPEEISEWLSEHSANSEP